MQQPRHAVVPVISVQHGLLDVEFSPEATIVCNLNIAAPSVQTSCFAAERLLVTWLPEA
jgi:hypothetical protein